MLGKPEVQPVACPLGTLWVEAQLLLQGRGLHLSQKLYQIGQCLAFSAPERLYAPFPLSCSRHRAAAAICPNPDGRHQVPFSIALFPVCTRPVGVI